MSSLQSLSQYGNVFQTKVIAALLTHKDFLININDILSDEYFDSNSTKWIINEILRYYNKYHCNISMDILKVELKKIDNEVLQISIKEQLREAYRLSEEDLQYVMEEFSNFCKNQQLKKALLTSVDFLNAGDYDSIRTMIDNALKAGQDKNIGHEYDKDIETRYRENSRNVIPFPWESFNDITQGGYGGGDLVLIFGNPKGGKSWAVMSMAAHAVKLGYNVVFYALELGETYVGKRFDAIFSQIPVDDLDNKRKYIENVVSNLPGKLVIKEYSPKRANLNTIESHLSKLDFKPDVIFIDYLDLLSNRKKRLEKKDDIDDVYTDAKGLAKELKIPIVSPSQANRSGANVAILESTHIASSFEKLMIADIVISLSRTRVDRLEGTGRWHFMGNRYGNDGCTFFSPKIDTSIGYFEIEKNEMGEEELENFGKKSKKTEEESEKKFLRQKFFELGMGG
jgi:replicative DNA helicase